MIVFKPREDFDEPCLLCKQVDNSRDITLIPIAETIEDKIAEARPVHIDCLDLILVGSLLVQEVAHDQV